MLKYLILILVIAGAWYGWRYMNRKPADKTPAPPPPVQQPPKVAAEDLKPCPVCGTYTTGQTCGRPECRPA